MKTSNNGLLFWGCLLLWLVGGLLSSCQPGQLSAREYLHWIDDPAHGLTVVKHINGLELKVKYLTPEYLVYLEETKSGRSFNPSEQDSSGIATVYWRNFSGSHSY